MGLSWEMRALGVVVLEWGVLLVFVFLGGWPWPNVKMKMKKQMHLSELCNLFRFCYFSLVFAIYPSR